MEAKLLTSVRLSAEAKRLLALLANTLSISQSAVLELAIRAMAKRTGVQEDCGVGTILTTSLQEAAMECSAAQRQEMIDLLKGQTIASLEYVVDENLSTKSKSYWVLHLTNGQEFSFKFMAELLPA